MSSIKKRVFIIFGCVWSVSAVVLLLYYYNLVAPRITKLNSIKTQLKDIQTEDYKIQKRNNAKAQLEKSIDLKNKLSNFIIDDQSWNEIMPYVSKIASQEDVSAFTSKDVSTDNYRDAKELKKIAVKSLDVQFNSSFHKFARFINHLESGKPILFVNDFSIDRNPDNYKENSVKMNLQVIVGTDGQQVKKMLAISRENTLNDRSN